MGKKVTLTDNEKATIIQGLHGKQITLQIAKKLNRDHRAIKKFIVAIRTGVTWYYPVAI